MMYFIKFQLKFNEFWYRWGIKIIAISQVCGLGDLVNINKTWRLVQTARFHARNQWSTPPETAPNFLFKGGTVQIWGRLGPSSVWVIFTDFFVKHDKEARTTH